MRAQHLLPNRGLPSMASAPVNPGMALALGPESVNQGMASALSPEPVNPGMTSECPAPSPEVLNLEIRGMAPAPGPAPLNPGIAPNSCTFHLNCSSYPPIYRFGLAACGTL